MRLLPVLAALLFVAALPRPAAAELQPWLEDRRYGEGRGVRLGNFELHPGVAGEIGYDSNYFQRADGEDPMDVFRLRLTPSLSLSTLGPQRLGLRPGTLPPAMSLRAGAFAAYNEIIATDSDDADEASDQRNVELGASLEATVLPERPWGADFSAKYVRVAEPSNDPGDEVAFDRGSVLLSGEAVWRPGGGLFEWRLGYALAANYFESEAQARFDNLQHRLETRGRWRFLPRTALLYDGSYALIRYPSAAGPPDGEVVRTRIGLRGLVTHRIALLGMLGWTMSFYDAVPENADTLLAQAEARYYFSPDVSLPDAGAPVGPSSGAVGYEREIANAYLSSFYRRDRLYANVSYFLGGVILATAEAGFSFVAYPPGPTTQAVGQRRIDARLFAEYRLSDVVGLNGTMLYDLNASDELAPAPGVADPNDDLDYSRWRVFVGARAFL